MSLRQLSNVLHLIHQTPLRPELWPEALDGVVKMFSSEFTGIVLRDKLSGEILLAPTSSGTPAAVMHGYREHFGAIDVLAQSMQERPEGEVVTDVMLKSDEIRRSEVWNDFYVRHDMQNHVGGFAIQDERTAASMVVYRRSTREFGVDDIELMNLVLPHVTTALRCWDQLRAREQRASALTDVLESLNRGVILLDSKGRVQWMNRLARRLAAQGDGIKVVRGELSAMTADETMRLRRLLRATAAALAVTSRSQLELQRPSGGTPLLLVVASIDGQTVASADATCIVFISDGSPDAPDVADYLKRAWGLTSSEAALACAIAEGNSLASIASAREVSVATVRTQCKQVLQKTGSHRQAELVRLVHSHPAAMLARR